MNIGILLNEVFYKIYRANALETNVAKILNKNKNYRTNHQKKSDVKNIEQKVKVLFKNQKHYDLETNVFKTLSKK